MSCIILSLWLSPSALNFEGFGNVSNEKRAKAAQLSGVCKIMGTRSQGQPQLPYCSVSLGLDIVRAIRELIIEASYHSVDASSIMVLSLWLRGQERHRLWDARH